MKVIEVWRGPKLGGRGLRPFGLLKRRDERFNRRALLIAETEST